MDGTIPEPSEQTEEALFAQQAQEEQKRRKLIQFLIQRHEECKTYRAGWEAVWLKIKERIAPQSGFFSYNVNYGELRTQTPILGKFYNSPISGRVKQIVSTLGSLLLDPSADWLHLDLVLPPMLLQALGLPGDPASHPAIADWLLELKERFYQWAQGADSNFYPSAYALCHDWYVFGNSCHRIFINSETNFPICEAVDPFSIVIDIDGYGQISSFFRKWNLSAQDAFQLYGTALHPNVLREVMKEAEPSVASIPELHFLEAVVPNWDKSLSGDPFAPPYFGYVIDLDNRWMVGVPTPYETVPYIYSRFFHLSGEIYGRSPILDILPDLNYNNYMLMRMTYNAEYATIPPLLGMDDVEFAARIFGPGQISPGLLDAKGMHKIQPLNLGVNVQLSDALIKERESNILSSLMVADIFPTENGSMSVPEVQARQLQESNKIKSILVKWEREYLGKAIRRAMHCLMTTGYLPPFPYEMTGISIEQLPRPLTQLQVQYKGPLSHQRELNELQKIGQLLFYLQSMAQIKPEILDNVDFDVLFRQVMKYTDIPPAAIIPPRQVKKAREAREAAAQQQKQEQLTLEIMKAQAGNKAPEQAEME
jgi:hypothetical protein